MSLMAVFSESLNITAILGVVAVSSLVGLLVQAAIEQPWIVVAGIGGWTAAWVFSASGTNGGFLMLAVATIVMGALTIRFVWTHLKEPRVWVPSGCVIGVALAAAAAM